MFVKEMSRRECHEIVASGDLARLACCKGGQPYIVPITYALSGTHLYCFSMPGQKIDWMRANPNVCLQVDQFSGKLKWKSVVITGRYRELRPSGERYCECLDAWSLLEKKPNWWEPGGLKPVPQQISGAYAHIFFSIDIDEMTGRETCEVQP